MSDEGKSEAELVAACVAGDAAAWQRLHTRYQPLVLNAAERALSKLGVADPQDLAQDVCAEVFAELLARERAALARFQGRSSLATWLRVLARRAAGRSLRRRRPDLLAEPAELRAADPSPSDVAHTSERDQLVRQQLASLGDRDRLALQLFYEGNRSYQEVGQALGVPADRIGTLLARARERLAKGLAKLRP
ncbi:MAG: sigma-70 family RNA polymerase sigma factor [Planctomycetota bacterium]